TLQSAANPPIDDADHLHPGLGSAYGIHDALGWVTLYRSVYFWRSLEDPNQDYGRRRGGNGADCRRAWTEAGWYGDLSKASRCAIKGRCPPCDQKHKS